MPSKLSIKAEESSFMSKVSRAFTIIELGSLSFPKTNSIFFDLSPEINVILVIYYYTLGV